MRCSWRSAVPSAEWSITDQGGMKEPGGAGGSTGDVGGEGARSRVGANGSGVDLTRLSTEQDGDPFLTRVHCSSSHHRMSRARHPGSCWC